MGGMLLSWSTSELPSRDPFGSGGVSSESHNSSRLAEFRLLVGEALRTIRRTKTALAGLIMCVIVVVVAVSAPLIAPYKPNRQDLPARFSAPSPVHLLGTDEFGRDVLSRVIWGSRISLTVGVVSVVLAVAIGVPLGLTAGYVGGIGETLIMRATDMFLAFPLVLLCMGMVAFLGFSLVNVIIAIAVALAPTYVRLVQSAVLSVRQQEFVQAAVSVGVGGLRIMYRHLLPNVLAPVVVMSTMNVAWAILVEGALSFLGIGVPPPTATWGSVVGDGRAYLQTAPWISTFGGLAISVTVLALNLFGDGLRDALDPTMRRGQAG